MEKIIYPGMKPAEPTKPVKLEGVPEKEITLDDLVKVRDKYITQSFKLTEDRCVLLLKFAKNRDSVVESPSKNMDLQMIQKDVQFVDAVIRRTLDLYRATDLLIAIENGEIKIDTACPTLKSIIPQARKIAVELNEKDLTTITAEETMIITLLNDYRMLNGVVNPK